MRPEWHCPPQKLSRQLETGEIKTNLERRMATVEGPRSIMRSCLCWLNIFGDLLRLVSLGLRSKSSLAAENLFLRKPLAFYQERKIKPRRTDNPTRLSLVWLSRCFDWRNGLAVVTPKTFIGRQRKGFQLFWRWKCQSGRPRIPPHLQRLIRKMARENPPWGEERIANELLLKLGLRVSPRTIRRYLPKLPTAPVGKPRGDQRWSTFLKNHAEAIIACDFCIVATVTFRILYVFVVMEHLSRRIVHANVTAHPTAAWTLQQLRETIPSDHAYRFIIHDRDAIFSTDLDASAAGLGLAVIKTPVCGELLIFWQNQQFATRHQTTGMEICAGRVGLCAHMFSH